MTKKQLFEKFILENIDSCYRFAFSYTHNKEDAEDIVSQSILKALRSIDSLRDTNVIKSWFFKIIANTSLTFLRKNKNIVFMDYDSIEDTNGTTDDYSELSFNEIIEKLDIKYKEILILRFFENMTLQEISWVLNINENTIKTRLYRALKILKLEIEGDLIWKN